jgi:protein-tyrosine phosphatase
MWFTVSGVVHLMAASRKHDGKLVVRTCSLKQLRKDGERVSQSTQNSLDPQAIRELVLARGRRLELEGVFNLRDVGGYPAAGGRTTRWRALLRSDALHRLDPAGSAVLASLGLRTVLDLRTEAEAELAPSALDGLADRRTHISLLAGDLAALPLELDAIYRYMIEQCGDTIGEAIRVLADRGALPGLVHCSAGKDRTGIVVALILAVLGVPDDVIAADYELSAAYLDTEAAPAIAQLQASTGLGAELTQPLLSSPAPLIHEVLARARTAGGSVDGYLLDRGLTEAELDRLRAALLV